MNKSDDSLFKLEKKLESYTEKEITMAKFNICKPSIKFNSVLNKKGLNDFLEEFKQSTKEVIENSEKYNIEGNSDNEIDDDNENKHNSKKNKEGKIELDLALGILEEIESKELDIKDIISNNHNDDGENDNGNDKKEDDGIKELFNFILKK